jgi:hypothetical protein
MIGSWVLGVREAAAMAMPDQGRRRVVGVAALGVVVLVAVGLAVPVARGLLEDEPVAPVAPVLTGGGPWERLPRPPVPGRASPLTAWTGDRAVFIGGMNVGDRLRMDRGNIPAVTEQGAAYHPR